MKDSLSEKEKKMQKKHPTLKSPPNSLYAIFSHETLFQVHRIKRCQRSNRFRDLVIFFCAQSLGQSGSKIVISVLGW